ncbi:MAG: sugar transporter, partial [Planctomycetota bacterium]
MRRGRDMSDKTASGAPKKTPLFVRPAKGNAIRLLTQLDGGGAAAPQSAEAPVPAAPPAGDAVPATRPAGDAADPADAALAPVPAARMRRRHWGLILSFGLFVVVPVLVTAWYLWAVAEDQYGSVAGFTVRQEEGQGASELLGGLAALTGGTA